MLVQSFGKADFDQTGPSGEWTAKDVFGHLAFWNGEAAKAIALVLKGDRPSPWIDGNSSEINAREVAMRRGQTLYQVMDEFRRTQLELVRLLERASESDLEREVAHKTEEGQMANAAFVASDVARHYRVHREAMQAWLAKN
jgi:hypothetical protein